MGGTFQRHESKDQQHAGCSCAHRNLNQLSKYPKLNTSTVFEVSVF